VITELQNDIEFKGMAGWIAPAISFNQPLTPALFRRTRVPISPLL
jgi:hypothetical protein